MRALIRGRGREDGAAAVEFGLVMPILLMIVFAIISFGWLFAQKLALDNAARQTARYSVVENRTCADVEAEALAAAQPLDILTNDDAHVLIKRGVETDTIRTEMCGGAGDATKKPCEGAADKSNIYVTLKFDGDVLVPVIPGMGSTLGLAGTGVFRCEWS